MLLTTLRAFAALLLLLAPTAAAQGLKNGVHEDARNGFKVRVPAKWTSAPLAVDEKWIVCQYLCNRSYTATKDGAGIAHQPQMRVIVITDEAKRITGPRVVSREETKDAEKVVIDPGDVPYQDYRDYVKRNQGAGHYYLKEEKGDVAGVPCDKYEIKLEKLTVPRRVIAWVFRGEDAEYTVEFEMLEEFCDKLAPACYDSLKSFRLIKRDAAASGGTTGPTSDSGTGEDLWINHRDSWRKKSKEERERERKTVEGVRIKKIKDTLPEGWKSFDTKDFFVVTQADDRYTKKVVDTAQACRSWLDRTFGELSDEYVMKGVIRIFVDEPQYRAYLGNQSRDAWSLNDREIVTFKGGSFGPISEFDGLFRGMVRQYIYDKDTYAFNYMPPWLEWGLDGYLGSAKPNGRSLVFEPNEWENNELREARREGRLKSVRDLIHLIDTEFQGSFQQHKYQSVRLIRYLEGPGARQKELKGSLLRSLWAVIAKAEELKKAEDAKPIKDADTEEEEEARFKEQREAGKKAGKAIIEALDAEVWKLDEKTWKTVEAGYAATLN